MKKMKNYLCLILSALVLCMAYTHDASAATKLTAKHLYDWARYGDVKHLRQFQKYINLQDQNHNTAICLAQQNEDPKAYALLKKMGASTNVACHDDDDPICAVVAGEKMKMAPAGWLLLGVGAAAGAYALLENDGGHKHKRCPTGYHKGMQDCSAKDHPEGWIYEYTSDGKDICGKCTPKQCPIDTVKSVKECADYEHLEKSITTAVAFAGDESCYNCSYKCKPGYYTDEASCKGNGYKCTAVTENGISCYIRGVPEACPPTHPYERKCEPSGNGYETTETYEVVGDRNCYACRYQCATGWEEGTCDAGKNCEQIRRPDGTYCHQDKGCPIDYPNSFTSRDACERNAAGNIAYTCVESAPNSGCFKRTPLECQTGSAADNSVENCNRNHPHTYVHAIATNTVDGYATGEEPCYICTWGCNTDGRTIFDQPRDDGYVYTPTPAEEGVVCYTRQCPVDYTYTDEIACTEDGKYECIRSGSSNCWKRGDLANCPSGTQKFDTLDACERNAAGNIAYTCVESTIKPGCYTRTPFTCETGSTADSTTANCDRNHPHSHVHAIAVHTTSGYAGEEPCYTCEWGCDLNYNGQPIYPTKDDNDGYQYTALPVEEGIFCYIRQCPTDYTYTELNACTENGKYVCTRSGSADCWKRDGYSNCPTGTQRFESISECERNSYGNVAYTCIESTAPGASGCYTRTPFSCDVGSTVDTTTEDCDSNHPHNYIHAVAVNTTSGYAGEEPCYTCDWGCKASYNGQRLYPQSSSTDGYAYTAMPAEEGVICYTRQCPAGYTYATEEECSENGKYSCDQSGTSDCWKRGAENDCPAGYSKFSSKTACETNNAGQTGYTCTQHATRPECWIRDPLTCTTGQTQYSDLSTCDSDHNYNYIHATSNTATGSYAGNLPCYTCNWGCKATSSSGQPLYTTSSTSDGYAYTAMPAEEGVVCYTRQCPTDYTYTTEAECTDNGAYTCTRSGSADCWKRGDLSDCPSGTQRFESIDACQRNTHGTIAYTCVASSIPSAIGCYVRTPFNCEVGSTADSTTENCNLNHPHNYIHAVSTNTTSGYAGEDPCYTCDWGCKASYNGQRLYPQSSSTDGYAYTAMPAEEGVICYTRQCPAGYTYTTEAECTDNGAYTCTRSGTADCWMRGDLSDCPSGTQRFESIDACQRNTHGTIAYTCVASSIPSAVGCYTRTPFNCEVGSTADSTTENCNLNHPHDYIHAVAVSTTSGYAGENPCYTCSWGCKVSYNGQRLYPQSSSTDGYAYTAMPAEEGVTCYTRQCPAGYTYTTEAECTDNGAYTCTRSGTADCWMRGDLTNCPADYSYRYTDITACQNANQWYTCEESTQTGASGCFKLTPKPCNNGHYTMTDVSAGVCGSTSDNGWTIQPTGEYSGTEACGTCKPRDCPSYSSYEEDYCPAIEGMIVDDWGTVAAVVDGQAIYHGQQACYQCEYGCKYDTQSTCEQYNDSCQVATSGMAASQGCYVSVSGHTAAAQERMTMINTVRRDVTTSGQENVEVLRSSDNIENAVDEEYQTSGMI
ncbi:MAG: hypothetical protein IJ864_04540, partial [Alphaproteobacteria bacterium]|nr:hypothetical protein [Alphaproteobacteria bacterium]